MQHDNATQSQNRASEPLSSTWLSANAGSGKTKVLTDRVARLLLGNVDPQNILCLTYTKAAASEMQNRLFKLLGEWAMKDDVSLRAELEKLGETKTQDLNAARRLFARAVETPGGLKIQTIHSFCAALLRRFPLEAGVSPQFQEMDDRTELILRDEVVEAMALDGDKASLAGLARYYSGQDFNALTKAITSEREHFDAAVHTTHIWKWFDLPPKFNETALLETIFAPTDAKLLADLVPILHLGSANDQKAAATLAKVGTELGIAQLEIIETVLLTGKAAKNPFAAKIGSFPTKATQSGPAAHLMPAIDNLIARIEQGRLQRIRLYSAQKTLALHNFARLFLKRYEAQKLQRGWVDFDDLIQKTGALLSSPELAAWVLYRLDGRIDHILVDEAQDTSPAQWKVIRLLAQEFTSGEGARDTKRTIFVVGDPKQSIYSFQGAEPAAFSEVKDHFQTQLAQVQERLENRKLEYSFRSAPAILRLADQALLDRPGLGESFHHFAFFDQKPGRVDLWPVVEKSEYKETRAWTDTTDIEMPQTHLVQLGRKVAEEAARLIASEAIQDKDGIFQPVRPGDILVLVRGRISGLFDEIIRACKELSLPIAGADRMRIGAELAVKDLTALLRFLATPEDDLSLAAALRSPLCAISEGDLYDLAQPRPKGAYLWRALRTQTDNPPEYLPMLQDLRDNADFLRPYELLERILTQHSGRARLLARLGQEAEDGIDALLNQALAYENTETPSLTGFIQWLDAMEVTIKRQMDNAGDQIRVMTVHGAKGLEAPIVILPDTAKRRPRPAPELLEVDSGDMVWKPSADDMPPNLRAATDKIKQADEEELARLLYVAATRAENWLIIAAAGDVGKAGESWYNILAQGMEDLKAVTYEAPTGPGLRYQTGEWTDAKRTTNAQVTRPTSDLPDWALRRAERVEKPAPTLTPSDLGGDKVLAGDTGDTKGRSSEDAMKRGRQIHRLLEILPMHTPKDWPQISAQVLSHGEDAGRDEEINVLLGEATALLTNPNLAHIFAPETLAEVDVSARLPALEDQPLQGIIDRLIITGDTVLIVDYKSNAIVPTRPAETPVGILRQMGAYIQAIRQIYPTHTIECAILWTVNAELMQIPSDLATAALSPP